MYKNNLLTTFYSASFFFRFIFFPLKPNIALKKWKQTKQNENPNHQVG